MTKSRNILPPRKPWTKEEDQVMRDRYPNEPAEVLAQALGRRACQVYHRAKKLKIEKSEAFYASPASGRTVGDRGQSSRFVKGQISHNKGVKRPGYAPGRMVEGQFKKGQRPHNWQPIGHERVLDDGYLVRKMTDTGCSRKDYVFVHVLMWTEANGPVPAGHAVAFKNKDKADIRIENLELLSRAELMRRNSYHTNYPKELAQIIQLRGALVRKINRKARELKEEAACEK